MPLTQPRGAHAAHIDRAHTYILRMDGNVFGLGRAIVTVVQPAQSIMGKHPTRGYAASSAPRRSLAQSKVRAVLVMVGDVFGKEPLQVPLVESNHMVEQLAAAAPHPTLGDTILPGTFERGPQGVYFQGSKGLNRFAHYSHGCSSPPDHPGVCRSFSVIPQSIAKGGASALIYTVSLH